MDIDYAFLAGSAEFSSDGRLYLMGADFNQLFGQYPYTVRSMAMVVKCVYPSEEGEKKHHLSVEFRKPDGGNLNLRITKDFDTPRIREPNFGGAIKIVLWLQNVEFPVPGTYTIHIVIDGKEKKSFRLFAEGVPKSEGTTITVS